MFNDELEFYFLYKINKVAEECNSEYVLRKLEFDLLRCSSLEEINVHVIVV